MKEIIKLQRSIIPACDTSLKIYKKILKETAEIEEIGAYKIGFILALKYGLPKIVKLTRKYTDKLLIYDHQKAATDIPETGEKFAEICKSAGIDAVILFPLSGPETEKAWINAAKKNSLGVIIGGIMTHAKYRESENGFIADKKIFEIYKVALKLKVRDFVVPGNKIDEAKKIKNLFDRVKIKVTYYAPGFIAQGGEISDFEKIFSKERVHFIIGRGLYEAKDIKKKALEYASRI
ncbi:MAG: orotidine 5'-phosphate decarboxylase / HUMPS family protein [Candidatus Altiarchaeota archaeon]